jgi:hypothetical protein
MHLRARLAEVREFLEMLRDVGIADATIPTDDGPLVVRFAPVEPAPPPPLADQDGKPVDLDDGMPWNARDPIEEANFAPKDPA